MDPRRLIGRIISDQIRFQIRSDHIRSYQIGSYQIGGANQYTVCSLIELLSLIFASGCFFLSMRKNNLDSKSLIVDSFYISAIPCNIRLDTCRL